MLFSFLLSYSLLIAFTLFCLVLFNKSIKNTVKHDIFKYLIVTYTINILLKSPMYFFCDGLGIMPIYYVWCGLVGYMVIIIISNLKNHNDYKNEGYFLIRFFSITFTIILYAYILHISVVLCACLINPNYLELISSYFWLENQELLKCYINPISPEDPQNQLNNMGYNRNGTNQPIATNIANALQIHYINYGAGLKDDILPANLKRFLVDYLLENDKPKYDKIMEGVNLYNNEKPKWWKIYNTRALREGLKSLP